uniref:Uncharacterized protein n=1 Tax=Oryza punctata TaxID=4537 RepID=A0A0E0M7Q9_ORYPU
MPNSRGFVSFAGCDGVVCREPVCLCPLRSKPLRLAATSLRRPPTPISIREQSMASFRRILAESELFGHTNPPGMESDCSMITVRRESRDTLDEGTRGCHYTVEEVGMLPLLFSCR